MLLVNLAGHPIAISVDGGKRWQPIPIYRTGDRWQATYRQPAAGAVSLRYEAADAVGNTVSQIIGDAYLTG
ncbi:hypothetical protein V6V47_12820 [Micromonospora sp. CPCC 205539]|uniref:hypothetical protein n=1 Tax=Micromonospora sp. CPCC 205539 TaxID=3122408 RepID=UPI002FEFBCC4